jgi:hypothetical protein
MGWFYPTALGETLMPVFGAVLPALCALARRDVEAHCTRIPAATALERESAEYADWREAMHHVDQIELALRRADGTVVPTTQISIQDTEALLELARHERLSPMEILDDDIGCTLFVDEDLDDEDLDDDAREAELEADLAIATEWEDERVMEDALFGLPEGSEMGRSQVFVQLADGAVPGRREPHHSRRCRGIPPRSPGRSR